MRVADVLFSVPHDSFSGRAHLYLQELAHRTDSAFKKYFAIPLAAFCAFLVLPLVDCVWQVCLLIDGSYPEDSGVHCLLDVASHLMSIMVAPFRLIADWARLYNPLLVVRQSAVVSEPVLVNLLNRDLPISLVREVFDKQQVPWEDLPEIYRKALQFHAEGKVIEANQMFGVLRERARSMTVKEFMGHVEKFFPCESPITNCEKISDVRDFFIGEYHGDPKIKEGQRFIIYCLSSPGDRVFLEGVNQGEKATPQLYSGAPLPQSLICEGWDKKEEEVSWWDLFQLLGLLFEEIRIPSLKVCNRVRGFLTQQAEKFPLLYRERIIGLSRIENNKELKQAGEKLYRDCNFELGTNIRKRWSARQESLVESLSQYRDGTHRNFLIAGTAHLIQWGVPNKVEPFLRSYVPTRAYCILVAKKGCYHIPPAKNFSNLSGVTSSYQLREGIKQQLAVFSNYRRVIFAIEKKFIDQRIAELEKQIAESQRIAELEKQIAESQRKIGKIAKKLQERKELRNRRLRLLFPNFTLSK